MAAVSSPLSPETKFPGALVTLAAVLLVAGFAWGMVKLFQLRFESGDIYPPYSTLRADPVGCRAFFEALPATGAYRAERNFVPVYQLEARGAETFFLLGMNPRQVLEADAVEDEKLEELFAGGMRLVVTLYPGGRPPPDGVVRGLAADVEEGGDEIVDLGAKWGFEIRAADGPAPRETGWATAAAEGNPAGLTDPPPWLSPWRLVPEDDAWEVVLRADSGSGDPAEDVVAMRRPVGEGELVLVADTYFVSNQGLRSGIDPALLLWLAGPHPDLRFDETHLGTAFDPDVATLLRRYRLHGFFVGLAVLAVLYVWKNTSRLVPADPGAEARTFGTNTVFGHDSASGFRRLLRREIEPAGLLSTAYRTWFKSPLRPPRFSRALADEVIAEIESEEKKPARGRDLVGAYNRISAAVSPRSRTRPRP